MNLKRYEKLLHQLQQRRPPVGRMDRLATGRSGIHNRGPGPMFGGTETGIAEGRKTRKAREKRSQRSRITERTERSEYTERGLSDLRVSVGSVIQQTCRLRRWRTSCMR